MKSDNINYGTSVDPEKLYPVTYTINQDRVKEYRLTHLKGKDMTENQIKIWLHFQSQQTDEQRGERMFNQKDLENYGEAAWLAGSQNTRVKIKTKNYGPDFVQWADFKQQYFKQTFNIDL